ncbi:hypothetical protein JVU11DRAFT_7015 [Chiua virens]|nr:hypothetical protein JVU11DRAFT_7015 [Chiua virens]
MGKELANAFHEVLCTFGLSDKVLSITCDNVSNNEVMIDHLAELNPSFRGECNNTQCFLHIVNLVAKLMICLFDVKRKEMNEMLKAGAEGSRHWAELNELLKYDEELEAAGALDNEGDEETNNDVG